MTKHSHFLLSIILYTLIASACDAQGQRELFNVLAGTDHQGPVLMETEATGTYTATYRFDEMVFCSSDDFRIGSDGNSIQSVTTFEEELKLIFDRPLVPGSRIVVEGRVSDQFGNTLTFTAGVWGFNERLPAVLINEFTTKGSASNPDRIELLVLSDGNLAGLTLYDGLSESFDSECILPSYEVNTGDRVVIEYSEGLRQEHPIEFCGGPVGLGANNGVISLYDSPDGSMIDAVLYSNRTSSSDTNYGGFGTSKVQQRALLLEESGQWDAYPIVPEAGIDSTYSTATRSFCRTEDAPDTDTRNDWHIVPTSKASFGYPNSPDIHEP
ncbi:MAG TPA: hypothetical protein DIW48_10095 [Sphaerochaeta sp.]|nr:hypothetical protein [Sphaerochaeta sp.]